jgi:hypothetical protein
VPYRHLISLGLVMDGSLLQTYRVRRHWTEKLLLWGRAYETTIRLSFNQVIGRGPTPEASEKAAKRKWNKENSAVIGSPEL